MQALNIITRTSAQKLQSALALARECLTVPSTQPAIRRDAQIQIKQAQTLLQNFGQIQTTGEDAHGLFLIPCDLMTFSSLPLTPRIHHELEGANHQLMSKTLKSDNHTVMFYYSTTRGDPTWAESVLKNSQPQG